ncbi:MAG: glycoside hydrolase family 127 protein [Bacteroidales bacterium]|nr:glycoside hydrolase family 127 protein [Bacteroidales bacterium]MBP5537609.1 glycoside hydrolase family 127 protein [Bacteroidales bacterium]
MNHRFLISSLALAALVSLVSCSKKEQDHNYPYTPVAFTSVEVSDAFWGQRLKASREVTIPLAFSKCEETGRYRNFDEAAQQMHSSENLGFRVAGLPFDDTDVYKTIEGASYLLQTYPDPALEAYIDSVLVIVAAAQEPDGYLYTARTRNPEHPHRWSGAERWVQIEDSHELYDLGHMIEGAIAHYRATGKRNFLDIAIAYADCVCREIGPGEGQQVRVPGHQIAEMALAKLYILTGDKKYLDEAKFFIDMRGRGEKGAEAYRQSHVPVMEQDEAVGHAVRAEYFYSGIADIAALTGQTEYIDVIDRIWDNMVGKKIYLTGGVGARRDGEAFGDAYELPNLTSYCETCAAVGNVYFNHRMFLLHGDSKYYDVLERSLYNGVISGVSLDGGTFFYPNPLESDGRHQRQDWFGCACCPSNICRFIPSVPGYVYAVKDNDLYVNLYMANTMHDSVKNGKVSLKMDTEYPWNGLVKLQVTEAPKKGFTLKLRIPGWVRDEVLPSDLYHYDDDVDLGYRVTLNGQEIEAELQKGYFCIDREWKAGDVVTLEMDMEPRIVKANDLVKDDEGRIAIERGPIVYCAEWPDNPGLKVREVVLGEEPELLVHRDASKLYGIDEILVKDTGLTLIPYYAWNHRGAGDMIVWMKQD